MASRSRLSGPAFALICAIAVAFVVLFMAIAGARFDTGVTEPEPMSAAQEDRQEMAIELTRLEDMASVANPDLSALAAAYADKVGGIWVPWPDGAPEGATNPPIDLSVPATPTTEEIAAQTDTVIALLSDSLVSASQEDAPLYSSMLLGLIAHHPTGATFDSVPLRASQFAEIVNDSASIVRFDVARQWFETAAARQDGEARDRSNAYREHLDSLVSHMLDQGTPDEREHIAALPDWFWDSPDPVELSSEAASLVVDHMVVLTSRVATDRRLDIVATAAQFLPALTEVPLYPGLEQTDADPSAPASEEPTEAPTPSEDPSVP